MWHVGLAWGTQARPGTTGHKGSWSRAPPATCTPDPLCCVQNWVQPECHRYHMPHASPTYHVHNKPQGQQLLHMVHGTGLAMHPAYSTRGRHVAYAPSGQTLHTGFGSTQGQSSGTLHSSFTQDHPHVPDPAHASHSHTGSVQQPKGHIILLNRPHLAHGPHI